MPLVGRPHRGTGAASPQTTKIYKPEVHQQFGLEYPRQLRWNKWQAEGEFIKTLRVKNVSTQVLRVSYKLLVSGSAFSTDFPETHTLSPGMVANIQVYFRPSKRQSYTEFLELLCGTNSIAVLLEAVLPASKLQLPNSMDFGCIPAKEQVVQQLPIKNVGDAPLRFSWKIEAPFCIVPAAGQLMPGQTANCEVLFDPQEAAAYRVAAACSLDNGELLTVQINGMAKFPFLSLESTCLEFGNVVVGRTAEGMVRFGNHSLVPAHFSLAPAGGSSDGVFSIQPMQGTLQPNSYSAFRIVYTPTATGTFSCETFSLSTQGGSKLSLVCQGTATGPLLRLSSRVFSFGNVKAGQTPSKVLYLENCSNVPLAFEFLAETNGVFGVTRPKGVLPPMSMTHTAVCFQGTAPANYWQRIVCLIKDSDPMAIDAFATCYDDTLRPPPLKYSHIAEYFHTVAAGEQAVPSIVSSRVGSAAAGGTQQQQQQQQQQYPRVLTGSISTNRGSTSSTALQAAGQSQLQLQQQQLIGTDSWQLLFNGVDAAPAVTVSDREVDFGSCSRLKPSEARSFAVHNNTNTKLLVSLLVPAWHDPVGPPGNAAQVFQVFPETLELRPNSSATVRLAFRPPRDGQYYVQQLMLLAVLKGQRSYRLVEEGQAVVPPWSISLVASGNTFSNCNPEFSPKAHLSTSHVNFPPCRLGEAVHQTVALTNDGDTPVHYRFTSAVAISNSSSTGGFRDGGGAASVVGGPNWFGRFAVLPSQGVLEPKSQHLVALRFKPTELSPAQLKLSCVFNNTAVNSTTLLLTGSASAPQLSWDVADGQLFFRPTCVGASSQRQVTLTNVSRVPLGWQWLLSKKLQEALIADPMQGVLRGFESTKVTLTFAPVKQQVYNARAALLLLPPSALEAATAAAAGASNAGPSVLRITAAGVQGEQPELDAEQTASGAEATAQFDASSAEKLILTVVAEATQGALSVEPSNVSFGVVTAGHAQRKTLSLINQSNGILRYSVQLVDDAPEGVDRSAAPCEFGTVTAALLAATGSKSSSQAGLEDCWVDEPDGVVNARAAKSITLTLLPRRRGQYKLSLKLRASSVPQLPKQAGIRSASASSSSVIAAGPAGTAGPGLVAVAPSKPGAVPQAVAGEPACSLSSSAEAASSSIQHSRSHGGAEPSTAAAESAAEVIVLSRPASANVDSACWDGKPPLAVVSITATASFPSLIVTDVFCQGLPKQIAWQMLAIPQLNAELRSAITEAELKAQALSDEGRLTNNNAAALLPPFEVDMGLAPAGQGRKVFWVGFTNEGQLPLNWELHSYDAPEVELENWVEPARPLTQAEKERAFIIDNKIFELHPHSGSLQPGEIAQVCLTFNPVTEGTYQLPLFLRVKDGKQLQLQLNGKAVSSCTQLPLLVRGAQSCILAAAPLGEVDPPIQCYTLRNGGPAPLRYSLDIAPLQQLVRQNYSAEIIKYAGGSPISGEISPGDVAVFNWLFQPLEPKAYSVVLPLSLGAAPPVPLLLRGRGYHPHKDLEQAAPNAEEAAQRWQDWVGFNLGPGICPDSRALRCSQEMLDLGTCLPASTTRRLLVLQNAAGMSMHFVWDLGVFEEHRQIVSGRLAITPATGVLEPGETCVCQVSFQSGLAPQLFSGEIFCYARCADPDAEAAQLATRAADGGLPAGLPPIGPAWDKDTAQQQGEFDEQLQDKERLEEEIIAQHPGRPLVQHHRLDRKIRNRLPLHLSMTEAVRRKFDLLDQQYMRTLQQQQQTLQTQNTAAGASSGLQTASKTGSCRPAFGTVSNVAGSAQAGVQPQLLTVTVQGRVLCKEHIKAGSYIPAAEHTDALKLLAVSHLLPAVEQPVSLLLPPGSMGPAAAVAAASAVTTDSDSVNSVPTAAVSAPIAAAQAVLMGMLDEVWADGEVAAAFEQLQQAPVPVFIELQQAQDGLQAVHVGTGASTQQPVVTANTNASASSNGDAEMAEQRGPMVKDVVQQPEFQAFADYVIDNALLGILQEGVLEQQMQQ